MALGGDLVVRLGMDSSRFSRSISKSRRTIRSFASFATGALAGIAAAVGGRESVRAYEEQRTAVSKLEAIIKSTGAAAGLTSQQIQKFAAARQAITNFGDEVSIQGAAILATFKEIRGQAFLDTLVAAQDISATMGTDLKSSMVQLGKAINDPIRGLSALTRVGVSFTEQQREQIKALQESGDIMGAQRMILDELKSEFGGAAEAARKPSEALANAFGDLQEKIGELISGGEGGGFIGWLEGVVNRVTQGIDVVIQWKNEFVNWASASIASGQGVFATLYSGFETITEAIKKVFFGMVNFQLSWDVIAEAAVNFFNTSVARMKWFGGVVADFLMWFANNWRDVFFTSVDYVTTLFINLGENIRTIFKEVWDVVSSGFTKSFSVELNSLSKGFQSTIKEQFQIREFVAPEAKKDAITQFREAYKEFQNMGKTAIEQVQPGSFVPASGITPASISTPAEQKKQAKTLGPSEAISLNSRKGLETILTAMQGGKKRPEEETAKNTQMMVKQLQRLNDSIQESADAIAVVGAPV